MEINENTKVWRYFDEQKAAYIIQESRLYLRRLDLLTSCFEGDPYEGTPTLNMFEGLRQAYQQLFPKFTDAQIIKHFEDERRATFVSCWQKSDHESWLMWKQYCKRGGGFALQTTTHRLRLAWQPLREKNAQFFLKRVDYLDHWNDQIAHTVPIQVFVKPVWFSDEKEIRFALFRADCAYAGTEAETEAALASLDDHETSDPIDLNSMVERIVLNPFSSADQKTKMINLIKTTRPELTPRVCESGIAKTTVLSRFSCAN